MGKRRLMGVNGSQGCVSSAVEELHHCRSCICKEAYCCWAAKSNPQPCSGSLNCEDVFFLSLDSPEGFAAGRPQQYLLFRPETVVRSGQLIGTLRLGQVRRCTTTWKPRPTLPVPKICMASFRNLTKVHHNSSVTGRPMARRRRVWGQCAHPAPGMGSRGSIKKIITYYSMVMLIDFTKVIGNDRLFSDSYG